MRGEFSVRWKFKGVRTPPGTKHGPWLLGIVRSRSRALRLRYDSSTVSKGKAEEDEDVESLESGESRHDTSASSVKEFGSIGSPRGFVPTDWFRNICTDDIKPRLVIFGGIWKHIGDVERSHPSIRVGDIHTDALKPCLFFVQPSILQLRTTPLSRMARPFSTLFSAPTSVNASRVTISQGATSSGSAFASTTPSCPTASPAPSPARGMTPFQKLKDHTETWQHTPLRR